MHVDQAAELYAASMTTRAIAVELCVAESTVSRRLSKAGANPAAAR